MASASQPTAPSQPPSQPALAPARPRADVVASALAHGGAAAILDDALAAAWRALAPGGDLGGDVEAAAQRGLGVVWDERDGEKGE